MRWWRSRGAIGMESLAVLRAGLSSLGGHGLTRPGEGALSPPEGHRGGTVGVGKASEGCALLCSGL